MRRSWSRSSRAAFFAVRRAGVRLAVTAHRGRRRRGRRRSASDDAGAQMSTGHARTAGFDAIGQRGLAAGSRRSSADLPPLASTRVDARSRRAAARSLLASTSSSRRHARSTPTPGRVRVVRGLARDALPAVRDVIVGNEPNLEPASGCRSSAPNGADAAAAAYERCSPPTYDALKAVDPRPDGDRRRLAPRGGDDPRAAATTHSPTAFILDLGAAYRASGRDRCRSWTPFSIHVYARELHDPARRRRTRTRPRSASPTTAKLVGLLGAPSTGRRSRARRCRSSTASTAIETQIPPPKRALYTGREPVDPAGRRGDAGARTTSRRSRWRSASRP